MSHSSTGSTPSEADRVRRSDSTRLVTSRLIASLRWPGPFLLRGLLIGLLVLPHITVAQDTTSTGSGSTSSTYAPGVTPEVLGLAGYAKVLCSAVFVSARNPDEAFRNSGFFLMKAADRSKVAGYRVDRKQQTVTLSMKDGTTRTAEYYGDQGCVIHTVGYDGVFFQPMEVTSNLPDPATTPWPMGDVTSDEPLPPEVDKQKLHAAVDMAFSDPRALTAAFLVVYKGQIIAERYDQGVDEHTQLESWSMGKSLTATLIGTLIQEGHFGLWDPAPVPAWRLPGDPRGNIRIADLLRMSSGLNFTGYTTPSVMEGKTYPDHMLVYTGAIDVFDFSTSRSLEYPPNTVGRYRNCDPLTLGYIFQRTVVEQDHIPYFRAAQKLLFDKIGIRKQVLEPDPYGNFVMTGYDYGTARNWGRIGMLYLKDGVWNGERILPHDFVEFVSTPAPAWDKPEYGGLFWLNQTGDWNLPKDAFYAAGGGGQRTFIVPSREMVIVRLGHFRGNEVGMEILNKALRFLMEAVPANH